MRNEYSTRNEVLNMKYANISINRGSISTYNNSESAERVINIGDHIQLEAIDNLYRYMGVEEKDIVYIEYYDLMDYDGEYVVLPINFILFNPFFGDRPLIFSPKIIPVFLGISFSNLCPTKEEVDYLRQYAPIGCRDEYTMQIFRRLHIPCYLNGCLTATLPRRRSEKRQGKVYFVDVSNEIEAYIPEEIKQKSVFMTQQYYGKYADSIDGVLISDFMKKQFDDYCENAEMVVTSRLHCASPCMAMGIPTIFVVEKYRHGYSWLEKLLPVYTKENFNNINWNPHAIEYEEIKGQILLNAKLRIEEQYQKYNVMYGISSFFENRSKTDYVYSQLDFLIQHGKKYWVRDEKISYAVWGVTQIASEVICYMDREYPNSELAAVFDDYRDLEFAGKKTIRTNRLGEYEKCCIIVTGNSSSIAARELFEKTKRDKRFYCLCFQSGYQREERIVGGRV